MSALLAAVLAASVLAADAPKASKDTIKMVEFFLKAATGDLPPDHIEEFLSVDPATLPAKLQVPFSAKKAELTALKKISDGKKKPPLRRLGNDAQAKCTDPLESKAAAILHSMHFEEVTEPEQDYLMHETNCQLCEMQEEFSLTLVKREAKKKGDRPGLRFFYSDGDPIMTLIANYRAGQKSTGTNFFGIALTPKCR